ncbi:HAD hydrolase-like protein [Cellulosimicrobium sp. Marseille-Q4280]|uniref:HAD hydrolase-like protein n=1 Tax=Cellulosimicrobium sp. Marseille-Q4280 TaxID=2937992 RepID=UPI0020402740|nr:HAD hydrolase-like protein [Cellulosimicrobium sp. Marseille-Q4280]
MSAPGYDVVLLDLDGTLADSAPGIVASVRHAYAALGLAVPPDDVLRGFIGPPLDDTFPRHGVPVDQVGAAVAAYREVYAAGKLFDNALFPGIPASLTTLRDAGVRLALATSKPEPLARRIATHLGIDAFLDRGLDDVFGATLDGTRRSKGDVIAHALAGLRADAGLVDLTADAVVMVGDREHDVHGAAEHGIACVGVAWGYADPGELEAAGARAVVGSPAELVTTVLGLARRDAG